MTQDLLYPIIFLILGLFIGGLIAWLMAKTRLSRTMMSKEDVNRDYVMKAVHLSLEEIIELEKRLAATAEKVNFLNEKLMNQQSEIAQRQQQSRLEFESISNRLLEEKSKKFSALNKEQIDNILSPLKSKIKEFEEGIERKFLDDAKDKMQLKVQIDQLKDLNQQLSQDANNLVNALKGDTKVQGNWGEFQLEMLLQKAGLVKGTHFDVQPNYKDEDGKDKRPDFIINLPDGKHLIVDSKVSLTAYERYYNAKTEEARQKYLKAHVASLKQHTKDLNGKNYTNLYEINSPDYLLLFVPIEPAFSLALQADSKIFTDALDRNIVIVTSSTLLATMRTVNYIWKQEKQKKSVLDIAKQSGLLYDKFVSFVEDMNAIGNKIDQAQSSWFDAMNKLQNGKRKGDTLIGRAQKIKELGAKTSKSLPKEMLDE